MRFRPSLLFLCAATAVSLVAPPARASLTDSEKARVRDFYAKGDARGSLEVRALLARPDLTPAEVAAAIGEASRRVPFDEKHLVFVRDLLFGPASQSSRSDLVPAVVAALLARGTEVAGGGVGNDDARAEELVRIHRFVAREIAGGAGDREGAASIRPDAFKAALDAYREHLGLPVFDRARLAGPLVIARTQAELAVIELASVAPRGGDVAAWIGADASQRDALEKSGVLVLGLAGAPAAKAAAVTSMLAAVPPAARASSALWIGKPWPRGLSARRDILVAQAPLVGAKRVDPTRLWSAAVEPSSPDAALSEVAFVLGRAGAEQLAQRDAAFAAALSGALERARAGGDAAFLGIATLAEALDRDQTGGTNVAIEEHAFLGHAVQLLLLDAPRALSIGLLRSLVGRPEPLEQLALALGVIATGDDGKLRETAILGRAGDGGGVAPVEVTRIKGTAAAIERFTIEGHEYLLARDGRGEVGRVERDGKAPALSTIAFARVPATGGETWSEPEKGGKKGRVLARLYGKPEVAFVDDGRIIVRSTGPNRDAVALKTASKDVDVELDLALSGAPGGVVLRAAAGSSGYFGAALFIEPGDAPRASLVGLDGVMGRLPLAGPVELGRPGPMGHHVRLVVKKDRLEITIGDRKLSATLPPFLAEAGGDVALAPGDRGELTVRGLVVKPVRGR